jgi:NAD+ kinase
MGEQMKWGLVCSSHMKKSISLAKGIYEFLSENGTIYIEKGVASYFGVIGMSLNKMNGLVDVVVTIGGDGTILRTVKEIEKPIFAINSGGMGFLSEVESKYAMNGLQQVIDGNYTIEQRSKLRVDLDGQRLPDATNEATVQTALIAKIMYFQLFVENELIETMGADGIIIATPTGSTSYALSVGGPIMDPMVDAMIAAPIAPFRLSARPWIVPLNKMLRVKVLAKSKETKLVIDGNHMEIVTPKSEITITGSEKKARFIRFGESFYQMVRLKLVR